LRISTNILTIIILLFASCEQKSEELQCGTKDPVPTCGNANTIAQPLVFKAKCAVCHMLDNNTTGPKLNKVLEHLPSEKWFDEFVRNQDSLKRNNNQYTIEIEKWSPVDFVHNFKDLNEKQLKEIKEYLDQN
jgi:nitrous oxide reductase accessory protein NosL